jgi:hypothetical protein
MNLLLFRQIVANNKLVNWTVSAKIKYQQGQVEPLINIMLS